jgi:hypothetical protein
MPVINQSAFVWGIKVFPRRLLFEHIESYESCDPLKAIRDSALQFIEAFEKY